MDKHRYLEVCSKKEKADIVLKNASIINVFTKEIIKADIAICDNKIIAIGTYQGIQEFDLAFKYVSPGFIDSHIHIESGMVSPIEFSNVVMQHGTTTLIADPHEIANVLGMQGIQFMIDEGKKSCISIYYMLPSCVPATSIETSGAILDAQVLEQLMDNDYVLGLGEMMNYIGVINGDKDVIEKINLAQKYKKIIDGHAPGLDNDNLAVYALAGIKTDHECSTYQEALERLRLGMYVQIRKGSAANNLEGIVAPMIKTNVGFDRCLFCTDDKHLDDIILNGHINSNIRESIRLGINPIEAIQIATINAARVYSLKDKGAIAPGYDADIVVFSDLEKINIESVMTKGQWRLFENKKITKKENIDIESFHPNILHTIKCLQIDKSDLKLYLKKDETHIIGLIDHELLTKNLYEKVPIINNEFCANNTYSKIVVVNRYSTEKKIGKGILKNFNISGGAIAQSISHDSHNIICAGDNDEDMVKAINRIIEIQGGIVVIKNGIIVGELVLPIAGLMSMESSENVTSTLNKMIEIAYSMNINKNIEPFITLAFMALPVIPEIKMTTQGLFDVIQFKHIQI